jgi:gluconolactonase
MAADSPAATRTIAASIGFTEGPLWLDSGYLLVTSVSRGLLYRVSLDGKPPEVAVETGGGPNGLALGPGAVVCVAQNGNATIQSRSPRPVAPGVQLVREDVVDDVVVAGCLAPNDLVVGPDGLLWFTDPGKGDPCVRTYDFESGRVERVIDGIAFPNGLAFGLDPEQLFIADSASGDILSFHRVAGSLRGPRVHARLPGGGPDGIAFDLEGNLYVAAFDADEVAVFAPGGERVAALPTGPGSRPTNLCFAGATLSTLVVTAASGGRVLLLPGEYPGRSPAPWLT